MEFEQCLFGFEISYLSQPNTTFYAWVTKDSVDNISPCLVDDIATIVGFKVENF